MSEFIGRCNGCYNTLGACTCRGFRPLENISAGKEIKQITEEDIKQLILKLPRYTCYVDCQCDCMEEEADGNYVKLEDILILFGAKNS